MYKRPLPRTRSRYDERKCNERPKEGTFLYNILKPKPTKFAKFEKQPVYQQESYIKLLKQNYKNLGIEFKNPCLPEYTPPPKPEVIKEPELVAPDRVYLKLRYLKSGIVRVKLETSFASLYEKYYSKNKMPPQKSVIAAYKSFGFSDKFLDRIKYKYKRLPILQKRFEKMFENIFNKETVKKTKKKKEEEEEQIVEDLPEEEKVGDADAEDDEDEDDVVNMENEMDVEVDEEDVEEVVEDDYFSDGGD